MRARIPLLLLLVLVALGWSSGSQAQMDVGRVPFIDSARAGLLQKEKDLEQDYEELLRADQETARVQNELSQRRNQIGIALKNVRAELNSVKLQLL